MTQEPFYRQMYHALAASIKEGTYAIGSALPTERELCEMFDVSRHTALEALRQLEQRGMISRRQGSGSTVLARTPSVRYEAMHETFGQLDDLLLELHPPAGHARSRQSDEGAGPA